MFRLSQPTAIMRGHLPKTMLRILIAATMMSISAWTSALAQSGPRRFGGAVAGISTLSADARSEITTAGVDVSLYKPENGPALNVLFGVHVHDYVTIQANYVWNRNDVALMSVRATESSSAFYEQPRRASQHAFVGDLLVYFRERNSRVRPYLAAGLGLVRLQTAASGEGRTNNLAPPPARIETTRALLRVAVGIDVALRHGWSARYSFSESVSGNPISAQLVPPGRRSLANFQNLFGVIRAF